ncbi:methyltransferase domain-containing protein [Novosphingobium sp.]|uniref:methyltransferase domain-containing protein n=1 Tax=Novosphingobium sp. TaxID=1874826 RepID=UPI003B5223C9
MTTPYDNVAYPSAVHAITHPERLGVAARLAGLHPATMNRARVLEIGGGDCLGLIAFAAAYPDSVCHGFDLAPSTIARGRVIAGAACPNVTLAVADIMTAHEVYAPASFDYVIAHGVYAWVPAPVRAALMTLIAHVLAPHGVALVSYNALPGGHIRQMLREMVLHMVDGITDPEERIGQARAFLKAYARPRDDDDPLQAGLRLQAASMAERPPTVLIHDEMGDCFAPQSLSQVVDAANRAGLRFLTDGGRDRLLHGFLDHGAGPSDDPDRDVLAAAQVYDYANLTFFRSTLLVRADAPIDRRLDPARLDGLWASAAFNALGGKEFSAGDDQFTIDDPDFAGRMRDLAEVAPARLPVSDLATSPEQAMALIDLVREWYAHLHFGPAPYAIAPGERPCTSALVRQTLARGEDLVVTLAHRMLHIDKPALAALLLAADGTRSIEEICAMSHGIASAEVRPALAKAGGLGLLIA